MALSGSIEKQVRSWVKLRLEWSGSQNISKNETNIDVKLYWISTSNGGVINTSSTQQSAIRFGGSWRSDSHVSKASLSAHQKKLIQHKNFTVPHSDEGVGKFTTRGKLNLNLSLDGIHYGTVYTPSKTFHLPDIANKSIFKGNNNWTAGEDRSFQVSRSSNSFTHEVFIDVQDSSGSWHNIKSMDGFKASVSTDFSTAENKQIFNILDGRDEAEMRLNLHTYNGSDDLGNQHHSGKVYAPRASTTTHPSSFNIGDTISGNISSKNSHFTHTIDYKAKGTWYKVYPNGSSLSWSFNTSEIADDLYTDIPDSKSIDGELRIHTYYEGIEVRSYVPYTIPGHVVNSQPKFSVDAIQYEDTNTKTKGITGNSKYMIENQSNLQVTIPSAYRATALNHASMKRYIVSVAGEEKRASYKSTGDVVIDFGSVDADSNTSINITAEDSRGLQKTVSSTIKVAPYKKPNIGSDAHRANSFEKEVLISAHGKVYPIEVNGVDKNKIKSVKYRVKEEGGYWSSFSELTGIEGFPEFATDETTTIIDSEKSAKIEFKISDSISSRTTVKKVEVGKPIMFIDSDKKSIGFGDFPKENDEVLVNKRMVFDSSQFDYNRPSDSGVLDIRSSGKVMDIRYPDGKHGYVEWNEGGKRSAFMGYSSDGTTIFSIHNYKDENGNISDSSDGFLTLRGGEFRIRENEVSLNGETIYSTDHSPLWTGGIYLQGSQSPKPDKKITDCPNGWILVWSAYNSGSPSNTSWDFTYVPKAWYKENGRAAVEKRMSEGDTSMRKFVYVNEDHLEGHDTNRSGDNKRKVLRYIFSF